MERVLAAGWSEYKDRKQTYGSDPKYFNYREDWEIDFLTGRIRQVYPEMMETQIRKTIGSCGLILGSPYPLPAFLACVMQRLTAAGYCNCQAPF